MTHGFPGAGIFFVVLLFVIPFVLIGGFVHMTVGWRQDLKDYIKAALKRESKPASNPSLLVIDVSRLTEWLCF